MNDEAQSRIQVALREAALTEEEQAEIVANALVRAQEQPPPPVRRLAALAAAVLIAIGGVWFFGRGDGAHQAEGDVGKWVEEQRDANENYLASTEGRAALAAVKKGEWVVVYGGKPLVSGTDLDPLLERARKWPTYHRFVFRKGEEGDREYHGTFMDAPWAGTRFLAAAELSVGSVLARRNKKGGFPTPDGRPWLPLEIGGSVVPVVLSTGSNTPLLLPGHVSPLFEIPGKATLEGIAGTVSETRRHLVRVKVEKLGIDGYHEALDVPGIGDKGDWRFFSDAPAAIRRGKAQKKVVVIVSGRWSVADGHGRLFVGSEKLLEPCLLAYTPFSSAAPKGGTVLEVWLKGQWDRRGFFLALDDKTTAETVRGFLKRTFEE